MLSLVILTVMEDSLRLKCYYFDIDVEMQFGAYMEYSPNVREKEDLPLVSSILLAT